MTTSHHKKWLTLWLCSWVDGPSFGVAKGSSDRYGHIYLADPWLSGNITCLEVQEIQVDKKVFIEDESSICDDEVGPLNEIVYCVVDILLQYILKSSVITIS